MNTIKVDRRVQRTRALLTNALLGLIAEKSFESITVQDILDRANLGRSTFYSHFEGKEDLFLSSMEEVIHKLVWGIEDSPGQLEEPVRDGAILSVEPIFQHALEQHTLHKSMMGGRGIDLLKKAVQEYLSKYVQSQIDRFGYRDQSLSVPPSLIANFMAGALLTILIWWLDNDMPYSPNQMDEMYQELTMSGVRGILGIGA